MTELTHDNWARNYIANLYDGKIEEAFKHKIESIPNKLYKFQPYEDFRLDSIEASKIYLSSPKEFNDAFDTKGIHYSEEFLRKLYSENDIRISFEQFSVGIEKIINNFYEHSGISCFSEELFNFPMWGNYADNRTGFCVEYCIKDDNISNIYFERFYPVIYLDKKFNFEKILEVLLPKIFNDEVIPQSVVILLFSLLGSIKHNSWSYEKEWRYIISEKFKEQDFPFKVKAIYVGDKFDKDNYDRMIGIAKKLNCELYQMTPPRHFDKRFTFIPQRIF